MVKPSVSLENILKFLKGSPMNEVLVLVQSIDPRLQVGAEQMLEEKGIVWNGSYSGREENPVKVDCEEWTTRSKLALGGINTYENNITLYASYNHPNVFCGKFKLSDEEVGMNVNLSRAPEELENGITHDVFD